jgi:hypothetical protein
LKDNVVAPPRPRIPFWIIGALFLVVVGVPRVIGFYVNWLWYNEVGFQRVWLLQIEIGAALFVAAGVVALAILMGNLRIAQRGVSMDVVLKPSASNAAGVDIGTLLRRLSRPVALAIALLIGLLASSETLAVLRALHAVPFGSVDPVFGRDIGYYVFTLPVLTFALSTLVALVVIVLLLVSGMYWLRDDVLVTPKAIRVQPAAALHLGILLAVFFLLLAARVWFIRMPGLLFSTTGPLLGASYTDLHATLPALRVLAVFDIVAAAFVLAGAARGRLPKYAAMAFGGYVAVSIVGTGLIPGIIQRTVVEPTELAKELPQLSAHIAATRKAWGLDRVELHDLTGAATLTLADIRANSATVQNVRLWDRAPLLETFGQLQEIRTYYDFVSIDDDRYWIDGRYRQVLLSPRELNAGSLPTRTFVNEHLTFTHGMGLTLGPVNQVTSEGLPVLFIKDLPPASSVSLRVNRPQLYYGELANEFVIARTRQHEFDYPAGDSSVFGQYQGTGGVQIGSFFRRSAFAWVFGSLKILLSQDVTSDSRILYYRDVVSRARRALPFLRFDGDPYIVISDSGSLYWMLDGYTSTSNYPYAQRVRENATSLTAGMSYMRNSVKVVIDAYNGTVQPFVADSADPIIGTYERIFPGIFRPLSAMPADLRAHLRYPEDLYRVQAQLYGTYHMDAPEAFYHREDQWQIPEARAGERSTPFMRHIVMRLPDEEKAEYIFMVPFSPRGKENLAAWMVARNDGEHYGTLSAYRFPNQTLVYGPRQIEYRINQETSISQQLSLWDQRGSQVARGDLLVIPIERALMYVQPIYLRAEGGRIPELKRVVVAYQDRVVMEETLDRALGVLFGGAPVSGGPAEPAAGARPSAAGAPPSQTNSELLRRAKDYYDRAVAAQRAGDWAQYGIEWARLGEVLRQLSSGAPPPR